MMLERTNGHAHDEPAAHRLKRIEQRLAQLGDANRQRIDALRDAVSDLLASELVERDERIARLENQIADLTHKLEEKAAVNQIADEAILRIEARQAAREEGRRAPLEGKASAALEASKACREQEDRQASQPH
jgi:polyhydroxyalkanoate synthesis regulator phasin